MSEKADEMGLESIAFCCISTGVFGYPKQAACRLAVAAVREYLLSGSDLKVIFDVFTDEDLHLYKEQLGI